MTKDKYIPKPIDTSDIEMPEEEKNTTGIHLSGRRS